MKVLHDTHVIIRWTMEAHKLSERVTGILQAAATDIFVSPVRACEIAYKQNVGKLAFHQPSFKTSLNGLNAYAGPSYH